MDVSNQCTPKAACVVGCYGQWQMYWVDAHTGKTKVAPHRNGRDRASSERAGRPSWSISFSDRASNGRPYSAMICIAS